MTTNHGKSGSRNSATVSTPWPGRACRLAADRQQLTAGRPASTTVGPEAKRAAAVILEVLAGVRDSAAAAACAGAPPAALLSAGTAGRAGAGRRLGAPVPRGRTISPDRWLASWSVSPPGANVSWPATSVGAGTAQRRRGPRRQRSRTRPAGKAQARLRRRSRGGGNRSRGPRAARLLVGGRFLWSRRGAGGTTRGGKPRSAGVRRRWESTGPAMELALRGARPITEDISCRPAESRWESRSWWSVCRDHPWRKSGSG